MEQQLLTLENFLKRFSNNFVIAEVGVSPSVMQHFGILSKEYKDKNANHKNESVVEFAATLQNQDAILADIEAALVALAHIHSVEAFRILENYNNHCTEDIRPIAVLALNQCRHLIETELTEQSQGLIITGLGGKERKLRYYFIIPIIGKDIQLGIKRLTTAEFSDTAMLYHSEIEHIDFIEDYLAMKVLIPIDVAVDAFVEECIRRSNELKVILHPNYFVTNGFIPSSTETHDILSKLRKENEVE